MLKLHNELDLILLLLIQIYTESDIKVHHNSFQIERVHSIGQFVFIKIS